MIGVDPGLVDAPQIGNNRSARGSKGRSTGIRHPPPSGSRAVAKGAEWCWIMRNHKRRASVSFNGFVD